MIDTSQLAANLGGILFPGGAGGGLYGLGGPFGQAFSAANDIPQQQAAQSINFQQAFEANRVQQPDLRKKLDQIRRDQNERLRKQPGGKPFMGSMAMMNLYDLPQLTESTPSSKKKTMPLGLFRKSQEDQTTFANQAMASSTLT
jgi:hypothetical protein